MRSVGSHCSRCLGQRQSDMISGKSNPYLENADGDESLTKSKVCYEPNWKPHNAPNSGDEMMRRWKKQKSREWH
jgi:hypothetical protein